MMIESIRKAMRKLMPQKIYSAIGGMINLFFGIRRVGWKKYRLIAAMSSEINLSNEPVCGIEVPGLAHPVFLRRGTSDAVEFIHSVIRNSYGAHLPHGPHEVIVDAGANVGDTTVWYLNKFPSAQVIAVEPDPDNFKILESNCRPYGKKAVLIHGALWPVDGAHLKLGFMNSYSDRAVQSTLGRDHDCVGYSPNHLLEMTSFRIIDIFKCDIEGAEEQLFLDDCDSWLRRIRSLYIEIHNRKAREIIMSVMSKHPFDRYTHRELDIFTRKKGHDLVVRDP